METKREFKNGICYVGLVSVFGGKAWYLHNFHTDEAMYFGSKKECAKAITATYRTEPETRKFLRGKLNEYKGRRAYTLF